jgi:hypothetical protein
MLQDIKILSFKDLAKILHYKLVEKAEDELTHQHDDEDVEDAIMNGLDVFKLTETIIPLTLRNNLRLDDRNIINPC